jgi:uncharacterized protein (DUF1800 family)
MPTTPLTPAQVAPPTSDSSSDPAWAWAPYQPSGKRPWTRALAGHLLRRAGFGATWAELEQAVADGPRRTVDRLVRPDADLADFNRSHDDYESSAAAGGSADALRAWWLRRMIKSPQPLLEKMTLFWHDHFAVSAARVPIARLMWEHVRQLRAHALGHFPALMAHVLQDPAVLLALGAASNRKARPNEHLARQLLQRYTLGAGQFSDRDVRETARALTGKFVLRGQLRHFEREHDAGVKTILGQSGAFNGRDVLHVALEHPATARHIVRRLFRWFVSETEEAGDDMLAPLAEAYAKDYDTGRLVETILRSNFFYSADAYRRRVKRPVEFALGIIRALEGNVPTLRLANELAALGENLYYPPTTKGWAAGQHWINPALIIARNNLALALVGGQAPYGKKLNPVQVAQSHGRQDAAAAGRFLVDLLLPGDAASDVPRIAQQESAGGGNLPTSLRKLTHRLTTLPEFQLA